VDGALAAFDKASQADPKNARLVMMTGHEIRDAARRANDPKASTALLRMGEGMYRVALGMEPTLVETERSLRAGNPIAARGSTTARR
jgi:hypothetical protein